MPGQFRHLAAALGAEGGHRVVFLTRRDDRELPGVERLVYATARGAHPHTHHYLQQCEDAILHGQAVARACLGLAATGFVPDLVIAHPGWGESLFVKDVWPSAPLVNYGEFFYRAHGADVNFDPGMPLDIDSVCKLRARNAHLLLALDAADRVLCPTEWQKSLHPAAFHDRIRVIFDGVDTAVVRPDGRASLALPNGRVLTRDDEVVTYVARNLEPYRGFHTLVRALPRICALRPRAQVVIVGGDEAGYGPPPSPGTTWRQALLREVEIDPARVHFLGVVPYGDYLRLLQISSVHVYLTVPFVLSWSAVEAMAAGCLIVGSRTPPVEEVIAPGENGLLVDFFSPEGLADTVVDALRQGRRLDPMRHAARERVLADYSVARCLPRHLALIRDLTGMPAPWRRRPVAEAAA